VALAGAPGGFVGAVGPDDVARVSFGEKSAPSLNGGTPGAIEETPGLNGNAVRSGINVAVLGVDAARGDEDVAAPVNVTFGSDGGISAGNSTKLSLVDAANELLHFALLAVEFVV